MIYFQGSWYCSQCGHSYDTLESNCKFCSGEDFQNESIYPQNDLDQLSDKDLEYLDFNIGNF
jgi:hypothetical protein